MKIRRKRLRFPAGGLNRRTSFQDQPPYTAYAAKNVWPDNVTDGRDRGGVRAGLATAVTGTLPGPIRMMHEINVQTETGTESVLVCSAGGNFYRRDSATGAWGSAIATSYTLAVDRNIQAAVFGQKLYIADNGIVDSGTDLKISSGSNTIVHLPELESGTDGALSADGLTFTSAGATFIANGVTAGVDVVRVTDTGAGGNATVGVYEIASVDSETQLTLSSSAGTTETGVDFVVRPSLANLGVDSDNHGLEVLESGNATAGFYTILSVSEDQVTLDSSPGSTSTTAVHYRFHRVPKVWDLADDTISEWTATGGTLPLSCNVIAYFHDRLVLAGAPSYPQIWYASAQGDPHDFNYDGDDAGSAVAGNNYTNGQIGDPITALIPHNRQCLVIGAEDSLYVLRGDPNSPSSTLDQLSGHLGPVSAQAWCKDKDFRTWMLTRDGIYVMPAGCGDVPKSFSREKIPSDLLNINAEDYVVLMRYDLLQRAVVVHATMRTAAAHGTDGAGVGSSYTSGSIVDWANLGVRVGDYVSTSTGVVVFSLQITAISGGTLTLEDDSFEGVTSFFVTPSSGAENKAYWLDVDRGGIWPMSYEREYTPASLAEYPELASASLSSVVLGSVGGVAYHHDRDATQDGGSENIESHLVIGPFPISSTLLDAGRLTTARILPVENSGSFSWSAVAAQSAETAAKQAELIADDNTTIYGTPFGNVTGSQYASYSGTGSGYITTHRPRLMGSAAAIGVSSNAGIWGVEQIDIEFSPAGRLR